MIRMGSVLAAALALAAAWPAWADFDAGRAAFDAGRFDEAVAEWRAAAESGDARAMLALGGLHARGLGAPQDYAAAHMWLDLAAGRGEAAAAEKRDALAARMTAEQVAAARDRAARWRPGGGVDAPPPASPAPAPLRGAAAEGEGAAAEWEGRVGETFRDCARCPEMVVVPPGNFAMGSPPSEEERSGGEGPVRRVSIPAPFAVGVHKVTRGEFSRLVSATGHAAGDSCWIRGDGDWEERSGRDWRSTGFSQTDDHPAVCVSWGDARAYAGWLSRSTGAHYRLLSEAEWEYAARAGTATRYHWGDDVGRGRANCDGCGSRWDNRSTAPVGSFAANAFGLHGVHGNAWEWTRDCWNAGYEGAPRDGRAWEGGDCSRRVIRAGSWNFAPGELRSANRFGYGARSRDFDLGFRVARTLAR